MKHKLEVEINLPREKVIELYTNMENMKHWVPGVTKVKKISGEKGEVGSKYNITVEQEDVKLDMITTVSVVNLPKEYVTKTDTTWIPGGMVEEARTYFEVLRTGKTKLVVESTFGGGILAKIFSFIGYFFLKNSAIKGIRKFKEFAEN